MNNNLIQKGHCHMNSIAIFIASLTVAFTMASASEQCVPHLDPAIGQPGVDGTVATLAVFDDGNGPALFAGGQFTTAGGTQASNIAKWDGSQWTSLGEGVNNTVHASAVFDDGDGPALYVGGRFSSAGGQPANFVAKWDGSQWSALGSGLEGRVRALAVFDDGAGPALYAGGHFNGLARWDGSAWDLVGTDLSAQIPRIFALTAFDDGSGPALYAAGTFDIWHEPEVASRRVARWDGSAWSPISPEGSGWSNLSVVAAVTVFDDGSGGGPALYTGGDNSQFQAVCVLRRWDGSQLSSISVPTCGSPTALEVYDDGTGPALYTSNHKWDGLQWSPWENGLVGEIWALARFDDGAGPAFVLGGSFTAAENQEANGIAVWRGCPNTPAGVDVLVRPIDSASNLTPATLSFDEVTVDGMTSIEIISDGDAPPSGFALGEPAIYYNITTTAEFEGAVRVCINYAGVSYGDESNLRLLHFEHGEWIDVTVSVDLESKTVCGEVGSFSPFMVVEIQQTMNPAVLITMLAGDVALLNLHHGIYNSLDAKLNAAISAVSDINQNNDIAAVNALTAFISSVIAQSGNKIPAESGAALIESAINIIELLQSD